MIREVNGTIFLTAEAFCDRYNFARFNSRFSYATGNLQQAARLDQAARDLRYFLSVLVERRRLTLSRVRMTRRDMPDGSVALEYIATKISHMAAIPDDHIPHEAAAS